jgi:hypothetical protein
MKWASLFLFLTSLLPIAASTIDEEQYRYEISHLSYKERELFYGVISGDLNRAKEALKSSWFRSASPIDPRTKSGKTPLMYAIENGNKEVARYLISQGADVNIQNICRETALIVAVTRQNKDLVQKLAQRSILRTARELRHLFFILSKK